MPWLVNKLDVRDVRASGASTAYGVSQEKGSILEDDNRNDSIGIRISAKLSSF